MTTAIVESNAGYGRVSALFHYVFVPIRFAQPQCFKNIDTSRGIGFGTDLSAPKAKRPHLKETYQCRTTDNYKNI